MSKLAKRIETNTQFMLLLGDKPGSVKTGSEPRAVPTLRQEAGSAGFPGELCSSRLRKEAGCWEGEAKR